MKIALLVKQVPDTEEPRAIDLSTGRIARQGATMVLDQINEVATEIGLLLKGSDKSVQVVAITMGPAQARDALRSCLAMGADSAIHVADPALEGADALTTARVLAAAVRHCGADLVVAGNESTDGQGGVIPSAVGQLLGWPCIPAAESVDMDGSTITCTVRVDEADLELSTQLPAIVSVTERAAEARFPTLRGIMSAKRKPVEELSLAQLSVDVPGGATSTVLDVVARPARQQGTIVPAGEGAVDQLVEFLVQRRAV